MLFRSVSKYVSQSIRANKRDWGAQGDRIHKNKNQDALLLRGNGAGACKLFARSNGRIDSRGNDDSITNYDTEYFFGLLLPVDLIWDSDDNIVHLCIFEHLRANNFIN